MEITQIMASMRGFHQPDKHLGLSYQAFFDSYIHFLQKSNTPKHKEMLLNEEEHQASVVYLMLQSFKKTLTPSLDSSGSSSEQLDH